MIGLEKFQKLWTIFEAPEAATGGVLWKKVFLKISHNSQQTPVPESLGTGAFCECCEIAKNIFFTENLR